MEGNLTSKLRLLAAMSSVVTQWQGVDPPRRAVCKAMRHYFRLLADCEMSQLELLKMQGCEYCFRQALKRKPPQWLRYAWLMEIFTWQLLVENRAGYDSRPEQPPPNPYYMKGPEIHYHKFVGHPMF